MVLENDSTEMKLRKKFPEVRLVMEETPKYVIINVFLIQEKRRHKGEAKAFMKYLIDICKGKQDIYLSASDVYGGNLDELNKFYKSLGFVKNKNKMIKEDLVKYA